MPDTILLCVDEEIQIGKSFLDGTYLWSTGSTDSTITVSTEGHYVISTKVRGCALNDTVVVIELEKLFDLFPSDTFICKGDVIRIGLPFFGDYCWSTGSKEDTILISSGGIYSLNTENRCGTFDHYFEIAEVICECNVYVPNIFSPNGDGKNDYLVCHVECDFIFRSLDFKIFDQWGNLIYSNELTDIHTMSWDGTFRGEALGSGTYVWIYEYEYFKNGIAINKIITGDVNIVK